MYFSVDGLDGLVRLDRLGSARDSDKPRETDNRDSDKPRETETPTSLEKPRLREVRETETPRSQRNRDKVYSIKNIFQICLRF
jgi:hypothetical protein